jgi:Domain of unknown function (DUF4911)
MELDEIYLQTRAEDIAYIKFIFESYEEVGIIRTVERKRAIIVLLAAPDFTAVARDILASLKREIPLSEIPRPAEIRDDWLMAELAAPSTQRRT